MTSRKSHPETQCIHAGGSIDSTTGAVMPPIVAATTFEHAGFENPREYAYSRGANPTRAALERCVAELEQGDYGFAYASGMAAANAILDTLPAGSHVLAPADIYGGTFRLMSQVRAESSALEVTFADFSNVAALENELRENTRLIWLETPTNPMLKIIDMEAVVKLVAGRDIHVAVDNTFATPLLQNPLAMGCDFVMHSSTKYLGGHSDVLGGVNVVADPDLAARLKSVSSAIGAPAGPFDAYLTLRGIKTLALRMERHQANSQAIAEWLAARGDIPAVYYPGLPDDPGHAIAARQMRGFGAVVTFAAPASDKAGMARMMEGFEVFTMAESLGGVESLVGHPPTMSHSNMSPEARAALGITDNLVRLSVGIEHVDDLIADLDQAIARIG